MPENSNPREGQADGLQDGRDRSALMKLARWLGRLPLVVATSILVLGTTVIATLAVFVLLQSGASTDTPDIYFFAAGITILVSWPIIHSAQKLIRELRGARETERRMAERLVWALDRAERANDEKSRFLATMSHELRTPLNAVIGFSDMIMSERLGPMNNPRYRDYAGDINSSGLHLLGIINEILDLAKIEAGKMHIDEDAICDIRDAIGKASMMVAPQALRLGVQVSADAPADGLRLRAMDRMVRQVLINILSNATRFTGPGGRVTLATELRPNGNLAIAIADTGIGMTPDDIRIALTPFGQVRRAQSRDNSGTGLGLPLARAMMELHGGRLTIRSVPGRGTTVTLIFPAQRVLPAGANVTSLGSGPARQGGTAQPLALNGSSGADIIPLRSNATERQTWRP